MVKRYDIAEDDDSGDINMDEFEDGEYVTSSDYDALAARLKKIMARCADLLDEDQFNELDAIARPADSAQAAVCGHEWTTYGIGPTTCRYCGATSETVPVAPEVK